MIPELVSERNLIETVPLVATFTNPWMTAILPVVYAEEADDDAGRLYPFAAYPASVVAVRGKLLFNAIIILLLPQARTLAVAGEL